MENLAEKVYELAMVKASECAYWFSYLTGVGWEYCPGDLYRDFRSRQNQRRDERIESKKLYLKSLDV